MVEAIEGNRAETMTMHPDWCNSFVTAHGLAGVTVVADAGMVSRGEPGAPSRTPAGASSSAGGMPEMP